MLAKIGESRHTYCVHDLRGKVLSFSPLRMTLAVGLSYMDFMVYSYVPCIPNSLRFFTKKVFRIVSDAFSACTERIIWFLFSLLLMRCMILIDL